MSDTAALFDTTAPTIQAGFGVTDTRISELMVSMQGMDIMAIIEFCANKEGLTIQERLLLMFEHGSRFGQWLLLRQQSLAAANGVQNEAMNEVMQTGKVH